MAKVKTYTTKELSEKPLPLKAKGRRGYIGIKDNPSEGCTPGIKRSRKTAIVIKVQNNAISSHVKRRSLQRQRIAINKINMDEAAQFVISDFSRLLPK